MAVRRRDTRRRQAWPGQRVWRPRLDWRDRLMYENRRANGRTQAMLRESQEALPEGLRAAIERARERREREQAEALGREINEEVGCKPEGETDQRRDSDGARTAGTSSRPAGESASAG